MPTTIRAAIRRVPQQHRAQERIESILAAAAEEVTAKGLDQLTMVGIAARAGITHTSIYHYFPTVEAVLVELVTRLIWDFDQDLGAALAAAPGLPALTDAVIGGLERLFATYSRTPVARAIWSASRYMPALRKIDDEDSARVARLIADRFIALAPAADRESIEITLVLLASLTVPSFEVVLSHPKRRQRRALEDYLALVRGRLRQIAASDALPAD